MTDKATNDIAALFSQPRPKDWAWSGPADASIYRLKVLIAVAEEATRSAYSLCQNGHAFNVTVDQSACTTIRMGSPYISIGLRASSPSDLTLHRNSFPSVVVAHKDQIVWETPPTSLADVDEWAAALIKREFALFAAAR